MVSQKLWVRSGRARNSSNGIQMRRISTRAMARAATRPRDTTPCGIPVDAPFRDDDDDENATDFIDDVIDALRVNLLRRTFPLTTASERLDAYLTSFASDLLYAFACESGMETKAMARRRAAERATRDAFDGGRGTTAEATSAEEREMFRAFARRCRETLARRLVERCYGRGENGERDKFWMAFAKRRFLNRPPPSVG